ncbi:MAG: sugar kinase, partial [Gemmatimonadetes bacterium]|nr:sugar kinase [Gemmatimonadota bacterium]
GAKTGYVTHVGNDPFQDFLTEAWRSEGVDLRCATPLDRPNGLYFISILPGGEREFTYYRAGSAASFLEPADIDPDYIASAKVVYASGITQAISKSSRAAVLEAFRIAREHNVTTAFDTNLRLGLWSLEEAREALDEILPHVDILLPSAPEESASLFGTEDARSVIERARDRGVAMVAVKCGAEGAVLGLDDWIHEIPAYIPERVSDTSGAGDVFNGGLLYGMTQGMGAVESARLGTVMAGLKVRGRGATYSIPSREEAFGVYEGLREAT